MESRRYISFSHELKKGVTLNRMAALVEVYAKKWGVSPGVITVGLDGEYTWGDSHLALMATRKETMAECKARLAKEKAEAEKAERAYQVDVRKIKAAIAQSDKAMKRKPRGGPFTIACLDVYIYRFNLHINVALAPDEGRTIEAARKKVLKRLPFLAGCPFYPREPGGPDPVALDHIVVFEPAAQIQEAA